MKSLIRIHWALGLVAGWLIPLFVSAQMVITIDKSPVGAEPIAVVPFAWRGPSPVAPEGLDVIIATDLANSGRFDPLDRLPATPRSESDIRWEDWKRLQIPNVVIGSLVQKTPSGPGARYEVEFHLYDVLKRERIIAERDTVRHGDLRKAAHQVADKIYEALTGERGAFDTRIAYVTETSDLSGARTYALSIADSDGFNAFPVLQSQYPIMSPAWSRDGRRLAYVSFEGNRPGIFVQDLSAGTRKKVTSFPGINGAPAWSPDDSRLAVTLSKDGNPEIYTVHLASGVLRRVTQNLAIDTEPAWAPDGRSLVFTSDRGGRPQLYRIPVDGGRAARITLQGTYNARAAFTPNGKHIAMVHGNRGVYRIGLLELATGELEVLTSSRLDESPTVSPNGRMILYATTTGSEATLAAVAIDGSVRQRIGLEDGRVRDPAWSPFLQ